MALSSASKIGVIICSTRTPRVGPSVSKYVKDAIEARSDSSQTQYSLVDVADFKLPVFDEVTLPAMVKDASGYSKDHTKAWSSEMQQYNGYIFVTPEYNYGIPGSTKNAIDFLYNEIGGKPAVAVSYGIHGGKISSESLVKTLEGMKLQVVSVKPNLPFTGGQGPDLMAAAGEGRLGDDTIALWDKEHKSVILSAVEELEKKLAIAV